MFNRTGQIYILLIVAILGGAVLIRSIDPFFVQALRLIAFDSYQLIGPAKFDPSLPVRVVDINEDSLGKVGQWPWPRTTIAELATKLTQQGAAAIAFDILFSEPDRTSPEQALKNMPSDEAALIAPFIQGKPTHDEALAAAITKTPVVLSMALTGRQTPLPPVKAGFATAGDDPKAFVPTFAGATSNLPVLDAAAAGIGSINWIPDRDQVVRRVPLLYRVGDQLIPTLPMEALRIAQGASTYVVKSSNASGESAFGQATGINHIRVGAVEIPTDFDGGLWLKFRKANPASYIPAWKVLAGQDDPNDIAGTIVIVGTSAPGLMDLRATPLDAALPGFEVHAQALEHILSGQTLTRPDFAVAIEMLVMIVFGVGLAAVVQRLPALTSAGLGLLAIAVVIFGGWLAYSRLGLLFDPSFTALVLFVLVTTATIYVYRRTEQQRGEVRRAFGYYVSPSVVNEIIANPDKLELGGEVRELTLLFCDVRNFTSISERMTAHELTQFINRLLTPLSEIIMTNRGTIDKYMGDAIMAFWNAPLDDGEHAAHALGSALDMMRRMDSLNEEWAREAAAAGREHARVNIGIGINSGDCCVGNLGSSQRFDYSAIGDDVNVASRYEGLSKVYGVPIVVGEPTVKRIANLKAVELDLMRVKGRAHPTRIYTPAQAIELDAEKFGEFDTLHMQFLHLYRKAEWDAAEAAIVACENFGIAGLKKLYHLYRERMDEWRKNPPAPDWDGTFTATSK